MIERYSGWEKTLREFCESREHSPFSYGSHDCCLFVCDAVLAFTGVDLAEGIRGYIGEAEAMAVLAEHGGVEGVAHTVTRRFEMNEIETGNAQRGDIVICTTETPTLCIIDNTGKPCAPHINGGLAWFPRGSMRRAWRVG